jgi:predicted AlkP superfamily phosphohydrolase/phosphomutase
VVQEVYRREEIYAGPHCEDAPDIVFLTDPEFSTWNRVDRAFADPPPANAGDWSGDHRMNGILCLSGQGVFRRGDSIAEAGVVDVAPTVLHAMGMPIPSDMDGRVLEGAFDADFLASHPVRSGPPLEGPATTAGEYSAEEEAGIRASLRGLGYIE